MYFVHFPCDTLKVVNRSKYTGGGPASAVRKKKKKPKEDKPRSIFRRGHAAEKTEKRGRQALYPFGG